MTSPSSELRDVTTRRALLKRYQFAQIRASIAYCLKAAVSAGEISASTDCEALASFMVAALQGAQLMTKVQRDAASLEQMKRVFLSMLV